MMTPGCPQADDGRPTGLIGTTDFGWPELGVVGEFDGLVEYGRFLRPGQGPGDAVVAEKYREDRIREEGLRVVRSIWRELDDFDVVLARLQRAFDGR